MSDKAYNITTSERSTIIECTKPATKRCPLTRILTPLQNLRVWTDQKGQTHTCTIVLRGDKSSILNGMPTVIDLAQQVCDACTRTREKAKTR